MSGWNVLPSSCGSRSTSDPVALVDAVLLASDWDDRVTGHRTRAMPADEAARDRPVRGASVGPRLVTSSRLGLGATRSGRRLLAPVAAAARARRVFFFFGRFLAVALARRRPRGGRAPVRDVDRRDRPSRSGTSIAGSQPRLRRSPGRRRAAAVAAAPAGFRLRLRPPREPRRVFFFGFPRRLLVRTRSGSRRPPRRLGLGSGSASASASSARRDGSSSAAAFASGSSASGLLAPRRPRRLLGLGLGRDRPVAGVGRAGLDERRVRRSVEHALDREP